MPTPNPLTKIWRESAPEIARLVKQYKKRGSKIIDWKRAFDTEPDVAERLKIHNERNHRLFVIWASFERKNNPIFGEKKGKVSRRKLALVPTPHQNGSNGLLPSEGRGQREVERAPATVIPAETAEGELVNYCPHCGTCLVAVRQGMQIAKQMKF